MAGEIDLLVNKNGKLYIYDIKTTSKSTVGLGLAERDLISTQRKLTVERHSRIISCSCPDTSICASMTILECSKERRYTYLV